VAALNLGTMASVCFFYDSELSRFKPRNFILSTVVSFLSLYIMSLYIMSKVLKGLFFYELVRSQDEATRFTGDLNTNSSAKRDDYYTETLAKLHLILDISGDYRSKNYCLHYEHQHE